MQFSMESAKTIKFLSAISFDIKGQLMQLLLGKVCKSMESDGGIIDFEIVIWGVTIIDVVVKFIIQNFIFIEGLYVVIDDIFYFIIFALWNSFIINYIWIVSIIIDE